MNPQDVHDEATLTAYLLYNRDQAKQGLATKIAYVGVDKDFHITTLHFATA